MAQQDLQRLLKKYLDGTISSAEQEQLLRYFDLPEESEILTGLIEQEIIKGSVEQPAISDSKEPMFERVHYAINARIDAAEHKVIPLWRKYLYRIAAAAVIVIAVGAFWILRSNDNAEAMTVTMPYGKTGAITLPDQSKVWLNAGTIIHYEKKFTGNKRFVTLENGDAFFDVVHDNHKPFIVKTGKALITVLGTSFEVNNFSKEKERISVSSGKVGVQIVDHKETTFLTPGQKIDIYKANDLAKTSQIATPDIAAWREQRLVFDDQPLSEVMQSLERKYNVHIEIANRRLLSERISTRLNNQPLKDVMTAIGFAGHFNYSMPNDSLIVIK